MTLSLWLLETLGVVIGVSLCVLAWLALGGNKSCPRSPHIRHGQWLQPRLDSGAQVGWRCSVCDRIVIPPARGHLARYYKYCPLCGATMDGGKHDQQSKRSQHLW